MQFGVLGPLMINNIELSQLITAPKPRNVLAMLLMEPNRAVPVDALIQELWNGAPPRTATTTVQNYVARLRRMLHDLRAGDEPLERDVLITRVPGYLLRVDLGQHDLTRYEELVAQGQRHLAGGLCAAASRAFSEALALWRGAPLHDVRPGPLILTHVRRLEESRLVTSELWISAELSLGHCHEVLSELTRLVGQHQMHEGFQAQYMIALFRTGRIRAALQAFHSFRDKLVREAGLEPSSRLQELHQSILSGTLTV